MVLNRLLMVCSYNDVSGGHATVHSLMFLPLCLKEGYLSMRRFEEVLGLRPCTHTRSKFSLSKSARKNVTKKELNILYFGKPLLNFLLYSKGS